MSNTHTISGVIIDIENRTQYGAVITIEKGRIAHIKQEPNVRHPYIVPGFVDAHVHVESSMLIPSRFAEMALQHGTVGVVTDPHEVGNVAGIPGIEFMIADGATVPMQFFFGAPSCVPASPLEKSGAVITAADVDEMMRRPEFYFLSEMMNFPGVVHDDPEVHQKLRSAQNMNKPIDGHAPGLSGDGLKKYAHAGIHTDHECSTLEEAIEKLELGMKILIREGSAAKNFDNLISLMKPYSDNLMFCTDDCHPDYLKQGHINKLVSRAVKAGFDLYDVLKVACINPVKHYHLPVGLLKVGDRADLAVVDNPEDFKVLSTYVAGVPVYEGGEVQFTLSAALAPAFPFRGKHESGHLKVTAKGNFVNTIKAIDGELITGWEKHPCTAEEEVKIQPEADFLKLVLLDRYEDTAPVVAFIKGFGMKEGALACSVAHDSHHIVAVGCDDASIDKALHWVVESQGGMCVVNGGEVEGIALPYFGLMTDKSGRETAKDYEQLSQKALACGSHLSSPFMTLSFMALTVIPHLKINHNGLFDGQTFQSVSLFSD